MWNKNCKILIMLGIIGLCAPSAFKVSGETTGTVNLAEWEYTINGDTAVLTKYKGMAKDVVIPLSGDLGTTNVKITKGALREAAGAADRQSGTLTNSNNDTSGTELVADNSTDGNPSDAIVDFSATFKDLKNIKKLIYRN